MKSPVLVSACLLGVPCRYDGKTKTDPNVAKAAFARGWIPVCPEQLGGLPTPRAPSERKHGRVVSKEGDDVTEAFEQGAEAVCLLAEGYGARYACLKERSPSCGRGVIYDGTFTGTRVSGDGVTVERLKRLGVRVFGESEIDALIGELDNA